MVAKRKRYGAEEIYRPGFRRRPGQLTWYDTEPGATEGIDFEHSGSAVRLVGVKSPVGRIRRYFLCPGCSKRCSALYVKPGSDELRCTRCHGLRYQSQR